MTLARLVRRVRTFLFAPPTIPLWRYCLLLVPLALIPTIALYLLAHWLLGLAGVNVAAMSRPAKSATLGGAILSVVFAPLAETFLLAGGLRALIVAPISREVAAAISALIWGCLHGLVAFMWFFGTVWSFFVFSSAYLNWRERSFAQAYIAAAVPHALINLTVTLAVFAAS
jgi:membrane protease YdiL (CAAX protease family)